MRSRTRMVGLLGVAGALCFAAPAFGAGWVTPGVVSPSAALDEDAPDIAVAPDGGAVVAWLATLPDGKHAVRVAMHVPGSGFGAEQTIPAGGYSDTLSDLHVAINAHGDTAVAWLRSDTAQVAVRAASGSFGEPIDLPTTPFRPSEIALGLDGATATVAASEFQNVADAGCSMVPIRIFRRFQAYPVSLEGTVGTPQLIYAPSADCVLDASTMGDPRLAVNARGDAVAAVTSGYGGDGKLTRRGLAAGGRSVAFSGRIGRKALRRGRHRVLVTAIGPSGASTTGRPARFTVVRR